MTMGHREASAVLDHCDYHPTRKFLLYRVAELVNPHNDFEYWQRPEVAAAEINLGDAGTVRKYMAEFVEAGWLVVVDAGGGRGRSTRYRWSHETAPCGAVYETAPESAETAPPDPLNRAAGPKGLLTREEREKEGAGSVSVVSAADRALPESTKATAREGLEAARKALTK